MTINYFSDSLLASFSLIPALISVISLNREMSNKMAEKISEAEKANTEIRGHTKLPHILQKIIKYQNKSEKRIKLSFFLTVSCVIIYLTLITVKTLFPELKTADALSFQCKSILFSYYKADVLITISATKIYILAFILSWIQLLLVVIIYAIALKQLYMQIILSTVQNKR